MDAPITLALAQAVDSLPVDEAQLAYEPKFDGARTTIERTRSGAVLRSKAGHVVTSSWMDLAAAAMDLPDGVLLDGEAVVYRAGKLDFNAVLQRSGSGSRRASALISRLPAFFACFDILRQPAHGSLLSWPYRERRALLEEILAPLGPPLQAVPMTTDPDVARIWWESLRLVGIEGLVIKRLDGVYPAGKRGWRKYRHSDTVDGEVVGFTGTRAYPVALAIRLPGGEIALSRKITAPVRAEVAVHLASTAPTAPVHTPDGVRYTPCPPGLTVEVLAGTTRHATITVTRVRD
ncbi:DNA ligase [Streptomyces spiroverticillatus]|uniref:DNA ligase n=1 Tax=Streptomyces finlayi TaxID=67296 RepID=A0A918X7R2_9ACTN|nr:ATP-dependent DNA ligase [Streptomyces finlayi]GHA45755.1 DNA ligase [Streptomyces spiroverticillatus]GHD15829.1 DNA ligase [Streptomyces finlayi]